MPDRILLFFFYPFLRLVDSLKFASNGAIISKRKFHIRCGRVSTRRVSRDSFCKGGNSMFIKKAGLSFTGHNCDTIDRPADLMIFIYRYCKWKRTFHN